jgi:hypothetical protein
MPRADTIAKEKWRVQVKARKGMAVVVTHEGIFGDEKLARDYFDALDEAALGLVELQVRYAGKSRYKVEDKKGKM